MDGAATMDAHVTWGDQLDVWSIDIAVAANLQARLSAALDDEERDRAARFVRPADALRYRIAHGALRAILGERTGVAARDVRFTRGEYGKPALLDGGPHFSLSHSGAIALVAVSDEREIGVDVERVRPVPDAPALARRHFSVEHAREIAEHPAAGRDLRFMRIWTATEAILKAEGTGLAVELPGLTLTETAIDGARAAGAGAEWTVRWLTPAPMHMGAIAARGGDFALRVHRFA